MVQEGLGNHSLGESGALSVESLATEQHRRTGAGLISMGHTRQAGAGPSGEGRDWNFPLTWTQLVEGHQQCLQWG